MNGSLSIRALHSAVAIALGLVLVGAASCTLPQRSEPRWTGPGREAGWPQPYAPWHATTVLPADWAEGKYFWQEKAYAPVQAPLPKIENAEFVEMDDFCGTCHEAYATSFAETPHKSVGCEKCHGAASSHLEARGKEPNTILSFKTPEAGTNAGKLLTPAERSEVCLQCHQCGEEGQQAPCLPASLWRASAHAHAGVACTDCHRAHYNVPPGAPALSVAASPSFYGPGRAPLYGPERAFTATPAAFHQPPPPAPAGKLGAVAPDTCYRCHADKQLLEQTVSPHQIGVPLQFACTACHDPPPTGHPRDVPNHPTQFNCTTCHDVHGNVKAETRKDLCLKCHDGAHMNEWRGSPHDVSGVACTDCHNPHPKAGKPMSVSQPDACYRCHEAKRELERVASAHQVLGPNGFNCSTCHRPHGRVLATTRTDVCLECHKGAPTMAWCSSTHQQHGVACADCHDPHPDTRTPVAAAISHTAVKRPNRLPMSVDEPDACYKCHPQIFALAAMPSHHPIREGKMVCSDCHDAHGEYPGNLKAESVNRVCYECHAEKEGPFVWEHPPVTENCDYCHEPHGAVANHLLRQPTTFLCLRCHTGHSTHGRTDQCNRCHFVGPDFINVGGGPHDPTIPTTPASRQALFTDCTQCHTQIHGGDLASGFECGGMMER